METISEIDRSGSLECWSLGHAVNRSPTMAVHLEAREDILSDRSINPTNLDNYIELAKSILGCYVAIFLLFLGHKHNFKSLIWKLH